MSIQHLSGYVSLITQGFARYMEQVGQCQGSECELDTAQQYQRELACEYYPLNDESRTDG